MIEVDAEQPLASEPTNVYVPMPILVNGTEIVKDKLSVNN